MIHLRPRRLPPALFAAALCAAAALTIAPGASAAPAASGVRAATAAHVAMAARTTATTATTATTVAASGQSYNGLALTPPMGWNDWYQYGCNVTQADVLANAQALVSSGLAKLGYDYVNLDDCWMATTRTAAGQLEADPTTFPNGIP
jgi:alpha-galactosidase